MPTFPIVTTPNDDTVHSEFVVPAPSEYVTVKPDEAVAPSEKLDEAYVLFVGCGKVMFWLMEPTATV